jgi:uncharacterized protein YdaU (DUF1376 family)
VSDDRKRLPWYPSYPADTARVVLGWPLLARLAYRELIDHEWATGELPVDAERVRTLVVGITKAQWRTVWPLIDAAFPVAGNVRMNLELELLRKHQTRKHVELSAAGKLGASKRWGKVVPIKGRPS